MFRQALFSELGLTEAIPLSARVTIHNKMDYRCCEKGEMSKVWHKIWWQVRTCTSREVIHHCLQLDDFAAQHLGRPLAQPVSNLGALLQERGAFSKTPPLRLIFPLGSLQAATS